MFHNNNIIYNPIPFFNATFINNLWFTTTMLDWYFGLPQTTQLLLFFIAQLCLTTFNAWLCFYIWMRRANKGALSQPIDIALRGSEVGQMIINTHNVVKTWDDSIKVMNTDLQGMKHFLSTLEIPSLEQIKEAAFKKMQGVLGGTAKAINSEQKELVQAAAQIEAKVNYPNVAKVLQDGASLVDMGLLDEETFNYVMKVANGLPQYLPRLDATLGKLLNNGGSNIGSSTSSNPFG